MEFDIDGTVEQMHEPFATLAMPTYVTIQRDGLYLVGSHMVRLKAGERVKLRPPSSIHELPDLSEA